MSSKKIVTVLGARPQFIKAGVVSNSIVQYGGICEVIVHTGQHFDSNMSDIFFNELGIPRPKYNLDIHGGGHGAMTGRMLIEVENILIQEKPDYVLVYGDTNSTLAGALAASKLHIPVAHVEAGLRSFNRKMPEEQNRIITDHLAEILFTPTKVATQHLLSEGIRPELIHQVGDVMFDAALYYGGIAERCSSVVSKFNVTPKGYVLATVHRAENTDNQERLHEILLGLELMAEKMVEVILPMHPRTKEKAFKYGIKLKKVRVIDPVGYLDMLMLEKNASLIITDSGGVQKEAYFHGVPCLTVREETEWMELVDAGWNRLIPAQAETILDAAKSALISKGKKVSLYGSGDSAHRIVKVF